MGIFDFLKKLLPGDKQPGNKGPGDKREEPAKQAEVGETDRHHFEKTISDARREMLDKKDAYYYLKPNEYVSFTGQILPMTDKEKVAFIIWAAGADHKDKQKGMSWSSNEVASQIRGIREVFMQHLLKMKLALDDEDILRIYVAFSLHTNAGDGSLSLRWPVASLLTQVERQLKSRAITEPLKKMLLEIKTALTEKKSQYYEKEQVKLIERIDTILFQSENTGDAVKPVYFPGDDEFAGYANKTIRETNERERPYWFRLMALCQRASGGKPSKKFLNEGRDLFKELGADKFKKQVNEWLEYITKLKDRENRGPGYTYYDFLSAPNMEMIKGLIWLCSYFHDSHTLLTIAGVAERAYRKIPGKGPAAAAIGNAAFYTLANAKGLEGVGHLSRLKLRIQQSNTQALIGKYLEEAAKDQGVSVHEIEDMAVDDYGLTDGRREYAFDDYKAVLEITGIGKTEIQWLKPDGTPQKSVPAFVKEKHAAGLKKMKDLARQIEITLTAQRDRLDRLFKSERKMDGEKFDAHYFTHGLMSWLTKRLIWNIEREGKTVRLIFFEGRWVNAGNDTENEAWNEAGKDFPGKETLVYLWHPVQSKVAEIGAWREFLLEKRIVQPLKQAFREVYLLTDAEINTRVYSNRMAAHILKQHQFNQLAKIRGWKYSLMGGFDNGRDNTAAEIGLPDQGLRAEYWINEVNADNAVSESGIWLYVATDQVRFLDAATGQVVELIQVPAIILSEVMRDVDLFVGVASVGNDPEWRDNGGIPAYRDYWQSYSFGELTEVAKTRKQILERLLPRLKIAKVAEIKDKFLVIRGKLRTYKIHLGSTNILMEPNDQYLCIVPDRSPKTGSDNVFLPFEGDNGLSIILSKALLLSEDDKITDTTITRQIQIK